MDNFCFNLQLLQEKNPFLAFIALQNRYIKPAKLQKEKSSWIRNYFSDTTKAIIVFGICTRSIFKEIIPWIRGDNSRHVIFVEDEISRLIAFLHSKSAREVLQNSQIVVLFNHSGNYQEIIPIGWEIFCHEFTIALSPYSVDQENRKEKVLEILESMQLIGSELKDLEVTSLRNIYQNYLSNSEHSNFLDLQDAFRGVPAIVCGAGTSLSAHYNKVRQCFSKALLIAGGRSMGLLESMSVPVHVAVALCPYVNWRDFTSISSSKVPLLYSSRVNFKAQTWHHGISRLIAKGSPYPVEEWLYSQNGSIFPTVDMGWDVICFSTYLAYHFGCDPIILIGVDHAGEYANGWKENKHISRACSKNIEGKKVYTQKDWIISSSWLNQFVITNPDRQYIHVNDRGLPIPNMRTMSGLDIDACFAKNSRNYDIESRVHSILQRTKRQDFVYNKSIKMLHQLYESMQRLSGHCEKYLNALEQKNNREQFLEQIEMESEPSFSLLFEPLWEMYKALILPTRAIFSISEVMLHRTLFIQRALKVHIPCIQEVLCHRNVTS